MTNVRLLLNEASADWRASRPALKWAGRWYTYAELGKAVETVASVLWSRGVRPGDVVAQMAATCVDVVVNLFAVLRVGAVYCPLATALAPSEVAYRLEHANIKAVICDEDGRRVVAKAGRVPVWPVHLMGEERRTQIAPPPPEDADLPAALLYTSGSTGRPKGVLLSAANLLANAMQVADRTGLTETDRILHVMPLHHTNGINNNLLVPFLRGAQVVLTAGFRAETLLSLVASERPTYFTGVPTMYRRLLRQPIPEGCFDSVRFVRCGSAPLSPELEADIESSFGVPVVTSYGLTEGTCTSTMTPPGRSVRGSVGVALDGQEVRVVNPTDGQELGPGQIGEVVVRGPNVMLGYLHDREATAATIRDGWLHTGDLGLLDENGYLFLQGRLKDIIVRGGENISPREIEEVLLAHDAVLDAAVVGVSSHEYGEEPWAFVVTGADESELLAHCRAHLARFKVPSRIIRVPELPRNPLGKVERATLRAWAKEVME